MAELDLSQVSLDQKREILKLASETRRFEIERFWARSVFFWGFIAAAFVSYAQLDSKPQSEDLRFLVACFGVVCSLAWTLLNRGGKYWQEAWETKVKVVEVQVLGAALFSNIEPLRSSGFWGPAKYSVSRLTIALSDFTTVVWVMLATISAHPTSLPVANCGIAIISTLTILCVIGLFVGGRSQH